MQIDAILKPFQRFGVHLGLQRIHSLLSALDNPHQQVPIIHVAGTNGKGSVCAYLSATLTAAGYKTGRYTSPHLIDWNERICINEQPISAEDLSQVLAQVRAKTPPEGESPTQFEVITAAAWLYFAQQQVDIAVIEVGLGGRLDATNVVDNPLVTVITSISREHWQQLGPTVANIAREKAGILKPGCPTVIGQLPEDAERVVLTRAQEVHSPIYRPAPAELIDPATNQVQVKSIFDAELISYSLVLNGQIQRSNSALAVATLEILQQQGWEKINPDAIANGIKQAKWPGRMQWVDWLSLSNNHYRKPKKILIDGAHNPAAAKVLRDYIDSLTVTNVTWIMGMLSTKEHQEIFENLLRSPDQLYLLPVPDHSSANPEELKKIALQVCPNLQSCQIFSDFTSALNQATIDQANTNSEDNLVVLCGSLYLIGNFLKKYGGRE